MTDHLDPVKLEAAAKALHDRNERLAGPLLKSLSDGQVSATERDCVETILRGYGVPELEAEVARLREVNARLDRENVELRQGVNGTEWENDLVANAPEWLDGDDQAYITARKPLPPLSIRDARSIEIERRVKP